jgi:hypothetical protein
MAKMKPRAVLAADHPSHQAVLGSVTIPMEAAMRCFSYYSFLPATTRLLRAAHDSFPRGVAEWDFRFPFLFAPFSDAAIVGEFANYWRERGFSKCLCADGTSWDLYQSGIVHEGFAEMCAEVCGGLPLNVRTAFQRICTRTIIDTRLGAKVAVSPLLASGLRFTTCLNTWSWSRVVLAFLWEHVHVKESYSYGDIIAIIGGDDMTILVHDSCDAEQFKRDFVAFADHHKCPMTAELVSMDKFTFYSSQNFPGTAPDGSIQYRLSTCIGRALSKMFTISDLSQRPTREWVLAVMEQKLESYSRMANHVPILGPFVSAALRHLRRDPIFGEPDMAFARDRARSFMESKWRALVPLGDSLSMITDGPNNSYDIVARWYSTPERPVSADQIRSIEAEVVGMLDRPFAVHFPQSVSELVAIESANGAADAFTGLAELGWELP